MTARESLSSNRKTLLRRKETMPSFVYMDSELLVFFLIMTLWYWVASFQTISVDISYMLRSIGCWETVSSEAKQAELHTLSTRHVTCFVERLGCGNGSASFSGFGERGFSIVLQGWTSLQVISTNSGTWPFIKSGNKSCIGPEETIFVLHGSNSTHPARKDNHSTLTCSEKINCCFFSAFLP